MERNTDGIFLEVPAKGLLQFAHLAALGFLLENLVIVLPPGTTT